MEAYGDFAAVYDTFMDEVPYEDWCGRICRLLKAQGIAEGLVLDMGCGTGTLTELLAKSGYDMIGLDNSQEMLNQALKKRDISGLDILYLMQDMREFELYGTVRAVISVCDSLNYVTKETELLQVFRLVNNYLDAEGLFLFDFNTVYKYREEIGDATIAENREECSFIWENSYWEEECLNEYDLTVFVRETDGRYRRFQETHYQKGYTLAQIRRLLAEAGLVFLEAFDGDSGEAVTETSGRILAIAGESGKEA